MSALGSDVSKKAQTPTLAALAERWEPRSAATATQPPAVLAAVRDRAFAALSEGLSWPAARTEAWRHTSLGNLPMHDWQRATPAAVDADALAQLLAPLPHAQARMVFVDGHFVASASHGTGRQADGLVLGNLRDLADLCPAAAPFLGTLDLHQQEAFAALNTAQLGDGALVFAPSKVAQKGPVQLVFVACAHAQAVATAPRVLVVTEPGAEISVSEHHLSLSTTPVWSNAVTELVVADNAKLDYAVLQHGALHDYHLASVGGQVGRDGRLGLYTFDDGAKLSRRAVLVRLLQPGAEASLGHVALARAGQHQATQATVQHASGHTQSKQVFKTAVAARGSSAFSGLVDILPNAPKANAQQISRALLLESNAQAYLQPQLQILTDDVRCAHGATVGELSQDSLFYLMSRGLNASVARELLTFAFLDDALRAAPATLRPLFLQRAAHWLGMDPAVSEAPTGQLEDTCNKGG